MLWASVLTHGTRWFEEVVWAAACHDLRRHDDGTDPKHGFRAGQWVRSTLPNMLIRAPANIEFIALACDWHVCSDVKSDWDHPILWFLKDADGLDRVRLYDLDPRFLRCPEAVALVSQSQDLYDATCQCDDPDNIWQVAKEQGLPVEPLLEFVSKQTKNLVSRLSYL